MTLKNKYCIIIPLYQNANTIGLLIKEIRTYLPEVFVFIVDDGSTDNPAREIKSSRNIVLLRHSENRGKGAALKTGLQKALTQGFQSAIFMDSDLQHPPCLLPKFIQKHSHQKVDFILGRRYFKPGIMPGHRILSNLITSLLISIRVNKRVHDSQCGYRLINLQGINPADYTARGFQFESEFIIKALLQDKTYTDLKIPTIYNKSMSSINNLMDTFRFLGLFIKSYLWT